MKAIKILTVTHDATPQQMVRDLLYNLHFQLIAIHNKTLVVVDLEELLQLEKFEV